MASSLSSTPPPAPPHSHAEGGNRGKSCMLYAALGDAIGYRGGKWEFNKSTYSILNEAYHLGGIEGIRVNVKDWPVSDDTVMHIATALALLQTFHPSKTIRSHLYAIAHGEYRDYAERVDACARVIVKRGSVRANNSARTVDVHSYAVKYERNIMRWYVACMDVMDGRAAGAQTIWAVDHYLSKNVMPDAFMPKAGGNGAAMRTMCVGLMSVAPAAMLVDLSMLAGLATHPNGVALAGGCMAAVFTRLAFGGVHPAKWWRAWYRTYRKLVDDWIEDRFTVKRTVNEFKDSLLYFDEMMAAYIAERFPNGMTKSPVFPSNWLANSKRRDAFYKQFAFASADGSTWNGSSGHDALIIAYDCFLFNHEDWHTLAYLAALHGGDSDSTASIAGAFFGAYNGMRTKTMNGVEFAGPLAVFGQALAEM